MKTRILLVCLLAVVFTLGAACGSSTEQVEPTTPAPAAGEASDQGSSDSTASVGWAEMDQEARAALMREQVMPELGGMFRAFDAEAFAVFTCATCHGDDFMEVSFAMPNGLSPLVRAEIPSLMTSDDEERASYARFMFNEVTPGMVRILGVSPYDHETQEGFGCLSCHATAQ